MCCDICPYYEECEELGKLRDDCCDECPDYDECMAGGFEEESDEEFLDEEEQEEY
ncbi:MAG: hypothetical protein N2201_02495 [candidate division WOR-3 bacterium]|nr:hypothetical protein [candidate division WOR-3 bacterium]